MGLRKFLYNFDLFGETIGLRYKGESTYHTLTGSIISIIVMILLLTVMIRQFVLTTNKTEIFSRITKSQHQDPTKFTTSTDNLMFMIGIDGINLNGPRKYVNFTLQNKIKIKNQPSKSHIIKFVQCKQQNWLKINPQLASSFIKLNISEYLCPQPGHQIELQGKYTSQVFKYLKIAAKKCNPFNQQNITCVSGTQFSQMFNLIDNRNIQMYFMNTLINPDQQQYIHKYLQDRNYIPFNIRFGVISNIFVDEYQIQTDQSITPQKNIREQKLWLVPELSRYIYHVPDEEFIQFYFRKSARNVKVERWYLKLEQTISFIGGLFSFLLIGLIVFQIYSTFSYEIDICAYLFFQDDNWHKKNKLTFFQFLGLFIFKIFKFFKKNFSWLKMEKYHKRLKQCNEQMDIVLLIRKILFLQKAVHFLFTNQQLYGLHLQNDMNIQQAEKSRKIYKFFKKIKDYCNQVEYQQNQEYETNNIEDDQKIDWGFLKFKNKLLSSGSSEEKKKKLEKKMPQQGKQQNNTEVMIERFKKKDVFLRILRGALYKKELENKVNNETVKKLKPFNSNKTSQKQITNVIPSSERGFINSDNNRMISSGNQIQLINDQIISKNRLTPSMQNITQKPHHEFFSTLIANLKLSLDKNHSYSNIHSQPNLNDYINNILGNKNDQNQLFTSDFNKQFQEMIMNDNISSNLKNQMGILHRNSKHVEDEISRKIWKDMSTQVKIMLSFSAKNDGKIEGSLSNINNNLNTNKIYRHNIRRATTIPQPQPHPTYPTHDLQFLHRPELFQSTHNNKIIPTGSQVELKNQQNQQISHCMRIIVPNCYDQSQNNYDEMNLGYKENMESQGEGNRENGRGGKRKGNNKDS